MNTEAKSVFLDYNSTTPVQDEVMEAMLPYFAGHFGNPSSSHSFGQQAQIAIDKARMQLASLIGAKADEIIFTGSGTESNNTAIIGIADKIKSKGNHIITTSTEHSSVYNTCRFLESRSFDITYLSVDSNGIVSKESLEKAITDKTILISIILANNETGVIQNVRELSSIAKNKGILLHSDAVQAAGKIPLEVNDLGIDLLSISGHKIYAPKGIGALFIKRGLSLSPLIHGGGQEKKLRSGTENVPAIVGFGKAAELAKNNLSENSIKLLKIRDLFEQKILNLNLPVKINGSGVPRVPNTSNISFIGSDSQSLLVKLDLNGICVSSGSACGSASLETSRTLKAMALTDSEQLGTIRFSFGLQTTIEEIDFTIEVLRKIVS
ncbi:MAG TPA: cysteine desulfurase NifS [Lentisphaeria bacterium]|nr:MAG: hypothetical protein A2X47_02960 [Lentisphaerae bacterium GWF2_38_69]HBM15357.1 cysteine desulfurase NifS [Lentisphaeria bacterium]